MSEAVAVLMTGFLRQKERTLENLRERLLDRYGAKLFVATWDVKNIERSRPGGEPTEATRVSATEIQEFYGDALADCSVRSHSLFERSVPRITARHRPLDVLEVNDRARAHNVYWMNRLYAQWYIVRDGIRLISEYEQRTGVAFDMICRTRSDVLIRYPIPEFPQDRVLVRDYDWRWNIPGTEWLHDFFAFGPSEEIKKLAEICFYIERLYDRQNIDTSSAENLMLNFFVAKDIPYTMQGLDLIMLR